VLEILLTSDILEEHKIELTRIRDKVGEGQDFKGGVAEHKMNGKVISQIIELSNGTLKVTNLGHCNHVLQFEDFEGNKLEWLVMIAKNLWYPPHWEGFQNQRYMYQIPSRMTYTLSISRIVEKRGLKRVMTPESYVIILNNDEEPTDDNSCYAVKRIEWDPSLTYASICDDAIQNNQNSLSLISEMMQVIYLAGFWDVNDDNIRFLPEYKAAFTDTECPGLGGNPWLQGEEKPIKPWLPLNEKGKTKFKNDGAYGLRQLWAKLFGINRNDLFKNPDRQKWFEENIAKGNELVRGEKVFDTENLQDLLSRFSTFRSWESLPFYQQSENT